MARKGLSEPTKKRVRAGRLLLARKKYADMAKAVGMACQTVYIWMVCGCTAAAWPVTTSIPWMNTSRSRFCRRMHRTSIRSNICGRGSSAMRSRTTAQEISPSCKPAPATSSKARKNAPRLSPLAGPGLHFLLMSCVMEVSIKISEGRYRRGLEKIHARIHFPPLLRLQTCRPAGET